MQDGAPTREALEAFIEQIPEVLRCRIVENDWGAIEEIHVLATTERGAKQVVRDVETALLAQHGIRVDHKRISVAQIRSEATPNGPQPMRFQVVEYRMDLDALHGMGKAEVVLSNPEDPGKEFRGSWEGRFLAGQQASAMASAALAAVNQRLGVPVGLADLQVVTVAGHTAVVAALSHRGSRQRDTLLVGTAMDRGDLAGSAVRAVLDAVNRATLATESGRGNRHD